MSVETELADLKRIMLTTANQVAVLDTKFDMQAKVIDERFRGHEHRLHALERDVEDTGRHQLDDMKEQLREKKGAVAWYQNKTVAIVGALLMLVLTSCASAGVSILVSKLGGH